MSSEYRKIKEDVCMTNTSMNKYFIGEEDIIESYCQDNGLYYYYNVEDDCVDIISKSGQWRLVEDSKNGNICLYHKNTVHNLEDGVMYDYHFHNIVSNYTIEYFMHIVEHDRYRENNPLYKTQIKKTVKGSKKWKKMQKRANKMRRRQKVRYVYALLDNMENVL